MIALAVGVALVVSLTVYGSAMRWESVVFALPQAWAVGVMAAVPIAGHTFDTGHTPTLLRWLLWSTLAALGMQQVAYVLDHQRADPLVLSGWLVLLTGLELAALAPPKLREMLRRLHRRGLLRIPDDAVNDVERDLVRVGRIWSVTAALCVVAALTVTWPRATEAASQWRSWAFGPAVSDQVMVVVAGMAAGAWIGRMIGYGRLGAVLRRRGLGLRVVPGHPDGAGGLKPIGTFYLYQSLVASLPAVFLAVWILMLSGWGSYPVLGHYRPYLSQYLWLLLLAIWFEILVFILPLSSIHVAMRRQKDEVLLIEADQLSLAIEAARARLESASTENRDVAERHLSELIARYRYLEKAPTWPVDPSIRRRFTLRNLGLLAPFGGYLFGQTSFWKQIADVLTGLG